MKNSLTALIVEGNTERAILQVLLDNDLLKLKPEDLLQEKIITERRGKQFAYKYLNISISTKIDIIRVLDSPKENFALPKTYQYKVNPIINVYTQPEIEILYIIYCGEYQKYKMASKNKKLKPSSYVKANCKQLGSLLKHLKRYQDNYEFWSSRVDELVNVLRKYKQLTNTKEKTIADLLVNRR